MGKMTDENPCDDCKLSSTKCYSDECPLMEKPATKKQVCIDCFNTKTNPFKEPCYSCMLINGKYTNFKEGV